MSDVRYALLEHLLLRHLTPGHLATLAGCATERSYEPGEWVFRAGEPASHVILVRNGRISLAYEAPERGSPQLVGGEAFGTAWLRPRTEWGCDGRAIEPTRTLLLDGACVRRKCETNPSLGYELARTFALDLHDRLDQARRELASRRPAP
jgi:CRP/FNR family transcriptional regulator, cyclic AMP receptor protein